MLRLSQLLFLFASNEPNFSRKLIRNSIFDSVNVKLSQLFMQMRQFLEKLGPYRARGTCRSYALKKHILYKYSVPINEYIQAHR